MDSLIESMTHDITHDMTHDLTHVLLFGVPLLHNTHPSIAGVHFYEELFILVCLYYLSF